MNGSTNPKDVLASMLGIHMQLEALALCAAKENIENFAAFYLDEDDPPAVNVLFEAAIEFVLMSLSAATEVHLDLAAGVFGINVDRDSEFFQRSLEEAAGARGHLLAVIFDKSNVNPEEIDYYMNQKGPLSRFMKKEEQRWHPRHYPA